MELKTAVVTFRDGRKLTITEENWPIAARKAELESLADKTPNPDAQRYLFDRMAYPMLAAAASGDVPTAEEAYLMPTIELDKWHKAVEEINPQWIAQFDAQKVALEKMNKVEAKKTLKKKGKKRMKSTTG
jgi:hypothetical protein